jgi:UDP-N-acetylglucosamine 2-epimerase
MPEELNRVLIDSVSTVFCCSTENSMANLKAEGVVDRVHLTGDLLAETTARHTPDSVATRTLLDRYSIKAHEYAFVTFHRAENTDDPARLASFAEALRDLPLPALFPAHPRTRKALERNGYWEPLVGCPHLRILQPLSYMETLGLLANAKFVLSDSSGIQREAYLLGSPCLVLRDVSEYPDLIAEGSGALVGVDYVKIREAISELSMQVAEVPERNLLGGEASKKIVDAVVEYLRAQEV